MCLILTCANLALVLFSGSVLPIVVYTVLYVKSRKLFRATPTPHVTNEQQIADAERQSKATKTFALLVVVFSLYSAAGVFLRSLQVIPTIRSVNGLQFFLFDFILTYNITDFLVVWKNKDGKQAIKKLINTIVRKQVCHSDTVVPPPIPVSNHQGQPAISYSVTATAPVQQQIPIGTPAPVPANAQTQPDAFILNFTPAADQEQAATVTPVPGSGTACFDTTTSHPKFAWDEERPHTTVTVPETASFPNQPGTATPGPVA